MALQIVSVTLGRLEYHLDVNDRLAVSVPEILEHESNRVHITAVAIPPQTYYRMDSELTPGDMFSWPVGAVLHPWGLTSEQLGVYGWVEHEGERIIIPVVVAPDGQHPPNATSDMEIRLRAPSVLSNLNWRIVETDGTLSPWQPIEGTVHKGQGIRFCVPAAPAGVVALEFAAQNPRTGMWLRVKRKIWRPGK